MTCLHPVSALIPRGWTRHPRFPARIEVRECDRCGARLHFLVVNRLTIADVEAAA